jgi:predicted transposase YdaD
MSGAERVKLVERFAGTTDPGIIERRRHVLELLLKQEPEMQRALEERGLEKGLEKGREEGVLLEARRALRRVLARRGLKLGLVHEARIDACTDATTLERWLDQAVTAATIAEALR